MIRFITIISLLTLCFSMQLKAEPVASGFMQETVAGMVFVRIPKGCFEMGYSVTESATSDSKMIAENRIWYDGPGTEFVHENVALDEKNAFELVTIANAGSISTGETICFAKDFWMAKYELTQARYEKVMGHNPSGFNKGGDYPVERVRWLDARAFIRKLNKQSGQQFRLPSESEWEYAARSGGKDHAYGVDAPVKKAAWYMFNSNNSTHPVGKKQANALGLFDMSGNVWEWTADCWNDTLVSVPKDGAASKTGNCSARVLRGGSWYDAEELLRTGARLWNDIDKLDNNSGFRLVLDSF